MSLQGGWLICSLAPPLRPQTTESYFWIILLNQTNFYFLSKTRTLTLIRTLRADISQWRVSTNHISVFRANQRACLKFLFENLPKPEFVNASFVLAFPVRFDPGNARIWIIGLSEILLARRKWKLAHVTDFYLRRSIGHRKSCSSAEPWFDLNKMTNLFINSRFWQFLNFPEISEIHQQREKTASK